MKSGKLFIHCRKATAIIGGAGEALRLDPGYIGPIPAWAEEHWYFKALCSDGTITFVASGGEPAPGDAGAAAAAAKAEAKAKAAEKAALDKAKAAALAAARREALEKGLDEAAAKKLEAEAEAAAIAEAGAKAEAGANAEAGAEA
jgi:pyruvate/2-oxoglutarate dehydrogenase complex dihydrolipoamide acyltransferase (E2) component